MKASEASACTNPRDVTWTLLGTVDITGFSKNEKAWTDGYKISSQITGADGGATDILVGGCGVWMSSESVIDTANGAICHAVGADATTATSMAANGHNLIHIPSTDWAVGTITVDDTKWNGWKLTLDKYGLIYSPNQSTLVLTEQMKAA